MIKTDAISLIYQVAEQPGDLVDYIIMGNMHFKGDAHLEKFKSKLALLFMEVSEVKINKLTQLTQGEMRTILLDNTIQAVLVKTAVEERIMHYKKTDAQYFDMEIKELKNALKNMTV